MYGGKKIWNLMQSGGLLCSKDVLKQLQCRSELSEPKYMCNTCQEIQVHCVRPDVSMRLS